MKRFLVVFLLLAGCVPERGTQLNQSLDVLSSVWCQIGFLAAVNTYKQRGLTEEEIQAVGDEAVKVCKERVERISK